jgi:hypothetical protein
MTAAHVLLLGLLACTDTGGDTGSTGASDSTEPPRTCEALYVSLAQHWPEESLRDTHDRKGTLMGVALADLDGDGWLDLVFAHAGGSMAFRNDGGTLVEEAAFTVDGGPWPWAMAVALADLDGDGDQDAYLGRWEGEADLILRNDGSGAFTSEPLQGEPGTVFTGSFGDADGDGDLDLFVARAAADMSFEDISEGRQIGDPNALYIQGDDGTFSVSEGRLPADTLIGMTFQGAWFDADSDGDQDLYVANDAGPWIDPNHLLLNDGQGFFSDATDCGCDLAMYAMGVAVGDADGNGFPDLYITDVAGPNLLLNQGDTTFVDATLTTGADIPAEATSMTSWGTAFVDLDMDQDMDLVVTFGRSGENFEAAGVDGEDGDEQPDVILLAHGDGTFSRADDVGFGDPERTRAVAIGDLDRDGRPDLVTAGKHFLKVWHTAGGCGAGVTVTVDSGGRNTDGLGARVRVEAGGVGTTQWMLPSTTGSSSAAELYFGLGEHWVAERVTVTWPDGVEVVREDVAAGTVLVVERP